MDGTLVVAVVSNGDIQHMHVRTRHAVDCRVTTGQVFSDAIIYIGAPNPHDDEKALCLEKEVV